MKYLTNIDLSSNELQNAVIQCLEREPASAKAGQVYFNTTDSKLYYFNGETWVSGSPIATDTTPGIVTVDATMSDSSVNPVQNKIIKAYIDSMSGGLSSDQFLDLAKTTFVDNFAWSIETYPDSINPNYEGKPVLVLALTDTEGGVKYSFINLEDLIDTYTGTTPITVSGYSITHNVSGVSANTYGLQSNVTPNFGESFNVPSFTVNETGHITSAKVSTVTLPQTPSIPSVPQIAEATIKSGSTTATVEIPKNAKIYSVTAYQTTDTTDTAVIVDWSIERNDQAVVTVSIAQTVESSVYCNIIYNI